MLRDFRIRRSALPFGAIAILLIGGCDSGDVVAGVNALANSCALSDSRPSHRGIRVVETIDNENSSLQREVVFDNGSMDIGVRVDSVRGRQFSELDQIMFSVHGRFIYKYRDAAVDQPVTLLENYHVTLETDHALVAGHPTVKFTFAPRASSGITTFKTEIRADETTLLPLSVTRFDESDRIIYKMVYESVEIGVERIASDPPTLPDPPERERMGSEIDAVSLNATNVPAGFRQSDRVVARITVLNRVALFVVDRFTDGLQHLFVSQGDPDKTFESNIPVHDPATGVGVYTATEMGFVRVVWGMREGRALAAFGPYGASTLADMIAGYRK